MPTSRRGASFRQSSQCYITPVAGNYPIIHPVQYYAMNFNLSSTHLPARENFVKRALHMDDLRDGMSRKIPTLPEIWDILLPL
jgi:hypothetical protein